MKTDIVWKAGMNFIGRVGDNTVEVDTKPPLGKNEGLTPKELIAIGLAGCTAMDVVALFRKHKQEVKSFNVETDVTKSTGGYPEVFTQATLIFNAEGNIDKAKYIEAVTLSQTKYCGVSAMLLKAFPIDYKVVLNGETIHEGKSAF